MENKDKPAYPSPVAGCNDGGVYSVAEKDFNLIGLTKREIFAKAAMQGLLANSCQDVPKSNGFDDWNYEQIAKYSIIAAAELLKQLEKE